MEDSHFQLRKTSSSERTDGNPGVLKDYCGLQPFLVKRELNKRLQSSPNNV